MHVTFRGFEKTDYIKNKEKYNTTNPVNIGLKTSMALKMQDIPKTAFLSRINFSGNGKIYNSLLKPQDIKRAVIVNDQDFTSLESTSVRTISGVYPNVPLRTDEFIVEDTRVKPIVPDLTCSLIYPVESLQFDQVNALVHASETASMIDNFWNMKMPWAFEGPIVLNAHARYYNPGNGEYSETWDNAFYSRSSKSIELLSGENKKTGGLVHGARSSDTIAHETSHAKLDGLEEHLSDSKFFTNVAIHEAFADFNAMLHAMQSDKVIDKLLAMTEGNLRKDNIVSMFDEQFGREILRDSKSCLRSAINSFKHPSSFAEIDFLPWKADRLGIEPHSFSELLTGALYEILVEKYEDNLINFDCCNKASVVEARDTIGKLFNRALLYLPVGELEFKDLALAMLQVDKVECGGQNNKILCKVFESRNILNDKDISEYNRLSTQLAKIKLPDTELNGEILEKILENNATQLGITENKDYKFSKGFIDKDGNKFFKFDSLTKIKVPSVKDKYYDMCGNELPAKEGITLVFNKNGSLISALSKELKEIDKKELLCKINKYCLYRYKPLQDSYDELAKEWEEAAKRKKEEKNKKKNSEPVPGPKPTIRDFKMINTRL